MALNLDKSIEEVSGYILPSEEQEAAEHARFTVRSIGNPAIRGYSNHLERAYGRAMIIALRDMVPEGAQVDDSINPNARLEFRITDDRCGVDVRWVQLASDPAS